MASSVFDITLAGAFFGGLLAFLSPCILPMVPVFLGYMTGLGAGELEDGEARLMKPALAFVAGFTVVFVALGATASSLGQLLLEHLAFFNLAAGIFIIAMGLHFLGMLRLRFLYRTFTFKVASRPTTLAGAFGFGLAFAFGWSPCAGPVLATVLLMAAQESSVARGSLLLFAYGLGTGLPFLAVAFFAGQFLRAMKGLRPYLPLIEKVTGGFLVFMGIMLMTGGISRMAGWISDALPGLSQIG